VVCIGGTLDHPRVDVVVADDEVGSHDVTSHLLARGSRRTAMIAGPTDAGANRVAGFTRALAERGRTVDRSLVGSGDWTRKGGRDAMRTLLSLTRRPDAVFCANDLMAIGAVDAAREAGLQVPADIAIAGFDDVDAATIVSPPLTTARNPAYDSGANAGRLLMSRLTGAYAGEGRTVSLACPLVVRESA